MWFLSEVGMQWTVGRISIALTVDLSEALNIHLRSARSVSFTVSSNETPTYVYRSVGDSRQYVSLSYISIIEVTQIDTFLSCSLFDLFNG